MPELRYILYDTNMLEAIKTDSKINNRDFKVWKIAHNGMSKEEILKECKKAEPYYEIKEGNMAIATREEYEILTNK